MLCKIIITYFGSECKPFYSDYFALRIDVPTILGTFYGNRIEMLHGMW
jgi:hypothetical protein